MKNGTICLLMCFLFVLCTAGSATAGPPLTNAEGVGGVTLNPFAYVANPIGEGATGLGGSDIVSKPNLGFWHITLSDTDIDWNTAGINLSLFNRLELGFGYEDVDIEDIGGVDKNNLSAKLNLIPEGEFDIPLIPAISVGIIYKSTDFNELLDGSGTDYYVVGTKTLTQLPVPTVLSAGVRSTEGWIRGVLGFGDDRDEIFFCNIDVIPIENFIVGWEYEDGADVGDGFETNSIWQAHVAWMHKGLTLVGAYVYSGDENLSEFLAGTGGAPSSLGDGWVVSAQYAF